MATIPQPPKQFIQNRFLFGSTSGREAPQFTTLTLERFDVEKCEWTKTHLTLSVEIEETKFDNGAFRDAFRAKCRYTSSGLTGEWVIKKHRNEAVTTI